jgi:hypothetical protein
VFGINPKQSIICQSAIYAISSAGGRTFPIAPEEAEPCDYLANIRTTIIFAN